MISLYLSSILLSFLIILLTVIIKRKRKDYAEFLKEKQEFSKEWDKLINEKLNVLQKERQFEISNKAQKQNLEVTIKYHEDLLDLSKRLIELEIPRSEKIQIDKIGMQLSHNYSTLEDYYFRIHGRNFTLHTDMQRFKNNGCN